MLRTLRFRGLVLVFFGLISLGQAYPFSYVWAAGQHAECGCNRSGRKCIHGCDLKRKQIRGCHSQAGNSWISPACAKQRVLDLWNFQGDPFLPRFWNYFFPRPSVRLDAHRDIPLASFIPVPEPPPPRAG